MTTDYRPIACDLHSAFERLAMRRAWVWLDGDTVDGPVQGLRCRVVDVLTREGAEYLELESENQVPLSCRLDRVHAVRDEKGCQIFDFC